MGFLFERIERPWVRIWIGGKPVNEELATLPRIFIAQAERLKNKPFLMHKDYNEWRPVSWATVGERVKWICLGLMSLGVRREDRIAVISETRPEYAYCCTAIANSGAIFVGIYHTNSPGECAHVITDAATKIVFAENQEQCQKIIEACRDSQILEKIIVFQDFTPFSDSPQPATAIAVARATRTAAKSKPRRDKLGRTLHPCLFMPLPPIISLANHSTSRC